MDEIKELINQLSNEEKFELMFNVITDISDNKLDEVKKFINKLLRAFVL
jgi:hypothetical protein